MRAWPANTVVMVRPARFGYNPETAPSNPFQQEDSQLSPAEAQAKALAEFEAVLARLEGEGVKVLTFDDTAEPETPDAVFPNNWFCTLPSGRLFTFPMESPARRKERRDDIVSYLTRIYGYIFNNFLEAFEAAGEALEGTGSLVFDHDHGLAFAALSSRTHEAPLKAFEAASGYKVVPFRTQGPGGIPVYHTNVVMYLGPGFAAVGADCIHVDDRDYVLGVLRRASKTIVPLENDQLFECFAGNMLALRGAGDKPVLVMSEAARRSLSNLQIKALIDSGAGRIVAVKIPTLERIGGGSLRCMLAEVF